MTHPDSNLADLVDSLGQVAYEAYVTQVLGRAVSGDPLPTWEELNGDPQKALVVLGWKAAGGAAADRVVDHFHAKILRLEQKTCSHPAKEPIPDGAERLSVLDSELHNAGRPLQRDSAGVGAHRTEELNCCCPENGNSWHARGTEKCFYNPEMNYGAQFPH